MSPASRTKPWSALHLHNLPVEAVRLAMLSPPQPTSIICWLNPYKGLRSSMVCSTTRGSNSMLSICVTFISWCSGGGGGEGDGGGVSSSSSSSANSSESYES